MTIEGLDAPDGSLHPVLRAIVDAGAVQCGFCTPGMIMRTVAFLREMPPPDRRADRPLHRRQPLPLHGLREDPGGDPAAAAALAGGGRGEGTLMRIEKDSLIGKSFPKIDAAERATGRAIYIHDLELPRMLHAAILRTDRVHARIVSIDTSAAEAAAGRPSRHHRQGHRQRSVRARQGQLPAQGDKVRCIRDEIAAVAAETVGDRARGRALIRVEYEDLPPVLTPEEALRDGAPLIHEEKESNVPFTFDYSHGDVSTGERDSDVVIEETYRLPYVAHCCLGTCGIVASFDARGKLTLHSVTQVPFLYRRDMAAIVGVPPEDIRVIQVTIGGGFGSKLDIYPVRADRRAPGPQDAAPGEARVRPGGGVRRLAHAPAHGDPDPRGGQAGRDVHVP